ncbi:MAG TPA: periplasmic heavy metal sensor [Caulobacteraceae bacterium]|jgi:uncharacterized membrane protein
MRPRWLIAAMIASASLNLFLIGAGAGVIALGARMAHETGAARPAALYWATQRLPGPARANVRALLRQIRGEVRPDVDRSRALRLQAWDGVAAAKPDTGAIKQALAQSRQLDVAVREKVEERLVDFAATLSPADRATLSAGFRQQLTQPPAPAAKP